MYCPIHNLLGEKESLPMNKWIISSLLLACGLLLWGCSPLTAQPPQATLATPSPTFPPAPTVTATEPPLPTSRPKPTLLPTLAPSQVDGLLQSSLTLHTQPGLNGHTLRQVTGWAYGFRSDWCQGYKWTDAEHLLLYPTTGQHATEGPQAYDLSSQPVVMNLDTGRFWLTYAKLGVASWCTPIAYWSQSLEKLIVPQDSGDQYRVALYTSEGELTDSYSGIMYSISPSATKLLMIEDTLIDLTTKKVTDLAWDIDEHRLTYNIFWSSDEKRIYRCCFYYADAQTGEAYRFDLNEFQKTGRLPSNEATHEYGQWARSDQYFLIEWSILDDGYPNYWPFFDPVTKQYYEVSEMAGIPQDWKCDDTSVSSDGNYAWIECWEGSYLVNLNTFHSTVYPEIRLNDIEWSASGSYAWVSSYYQNKPDSQLQILSVASQELAPLSIDWSHDSYPQWHPTDESLAYLSSDKSSLILVDAPSMTTQQVPLPIPFRTLFWSPRGDRLALQAEDGSLWQIDYPSLAHLEQLTASSPQVRNISWSPDGLSLAYLGGADVFVVDAR